MKTSDSFKLLTKSSRTLMALICLLVFHAATAKSDAVTAESFNKSTRLMLNLPDEAIHTDNSSLMQNSPTVVNSAEQGQIVIGSRKKNPVNLDCGMDVYQNAAPEVPLSSRLSGECDVKYHY